MKSESVGRIQIALAGNPNVGKTSLFNRLTGDHQHVGNWPGVTVERISGKSKYSGHQFDIIDLPGTYSISGKAMDEQIARNHLVTEPPNVLVQVIESTNLERNLYLTSQLLELKIPMVLALNKSDLLKKRGIEVDTNALASTLGVGVVETDSKSGEGFDALKEAIMDVFLAKRVPKPLQLQTTAAESLLDRISDSIDTSQRSAFPPSKWLAIRVIEEDECVSDQLANTVLKELESEFRDIELEEIALQLTDNRYEAISKLIEEIQSGGVEEITTNDMLDSLLTHPLLGIPIFLAIVWGAFQLTYIAAAPFMEVIDMGFGWTAGYVADNVHPDWLGSLIGDGVIGGVGFVMIFVPNIFILFLLLSILEESGYLSRAAFLLDKHMFKLGLRGKSFIPMLMGFGCNVPAIMATRSIEDKKDRLLSIMVIPFMSCSARLPVYVLLAGAFFESQAGNVVFGLYLLGILFAMFSARVLRRTVLKGEPAPFLMEFSPYQKPTLRNGFESAWGHSQHYLKKAGTIILGGAIIIWFLASMPWGVEYGGGDSWAGSLGKIIAPLFSPLGFNWKITVALIFGFVAKEVVVGALGTLYSGGEDTGILTETIQADPNFGPLVATSLMVFTLLYTPCLATIGVIKKETDSWKWAAISVIWTTGVAWLAALLVYQVGRLIVGGV